MASIKLPRNLRLKFGNMRFRKELGRLKNQRKTVGFDEAKRIGLLYDATDEANSEIIKEFVKKIRGAHKEVFTLGYVDKKELPATQFPLLGIDYFTFTDLNWQMIPVNAAATNFMNEQYDIVINLADNDIFPLRYIATVCKAFFRVGRYNDDFISCYDMMIDTQNRTDLTYFIEESENFLRKIKSTV